MKILRYLLLVLGILFIVINAIAFTVAFPNYYRAFSAIEDTPEKVGYAIGSVMFFFLGGLFLLISSRINRKLKNKKVARELLSSLPQ